MVSKNNHDSKNKGYLFDDTPRGILEALLVAGGIAIALSTAPTLFMALAGIGYIISAQDRARRKRVQRSFQYLNRCGYVTKRDRSNGFRIVLTPRGRVRALHYTKRRALNTSVPRPKVWDRKWRLILFDIPTGERAKRNAFRSFIRRQGAVMLQKSVWVHPFDCVEQIDLLKHIFDFSDVHLRLIVTDSIGIDAEFRRHFKL